MTSGTGWFDRDTLTQERPQELTAAQRYRAARYVASSAEDASDAAQLLEMLGLDASEGKQAASGTRGAA